MKSITCQGCTCFIYFLLVTIFNHGKLHAQGNTSLELKNIQIHFLNVSGKYVQNAMECLPAVYRVITSNGNQGIDICIQNIPKRVYNEMMSAGIDHDSDSYHLIQRLWKQLADIDRKWQSLLRKSDFEVVGSKHELVNILESIVDDYKSYQLLHEALAEEVYSNNAYRSSFRIKRDENLSTVERQIREFLIHEKRLLRELNFQINEERTVFFSPNSLNKHIILSKRMLEELEEGDNLPYANVKFYQQFKEKIAERIDFQSHILNQKGTVENLSAHERNQLYYDLLTHYNDQLIPIFFNYVTYAARLSNHETLYEPILIPEFELISGDN